MITLDPAQLYALHKSESEAIQASGRDGAGKSTLANAIAAQSARNSLSCLLIGRDPSLDQPIAFRTVDHFHQVLSERSQFNSQTGVSRPEIVQRSVLLFDPIEARAKVDPIAAKAALSLLRRARELIQQFKFDADEVEESVASNQALPSETLDLAFLAADDAAKLADELWSGNARAGRTFGDLKELLAGANVEIPANEHTLKLIVCDDTAFEAALLKLLSRRSEQKDEQAIAAVVSQLRRPRSADKSLADCHQHAVWMSRVLNDAIALVRKHGGLKAALAANPDSDGAKAIGHFIRMRPDQGSASAVRAFDSALRDYQHDSAALDPQLNQYGSRPLGSFARPSEDGGQQVEANPGSFIQRIRSARYAARQLPGLLERIRASLPRSLGQRFESVAIEDAGAVLEAVNHNDPRQRAASELRQLRALFTQTGFGDPFSAPPDFESRIEKARAPVAPTKVATSAYNAEVLDLLLDLTTYKEYGNLIDWPPSIVRARSKEELVEIAQSGRQFDVVVADDAPDVAAQLLDAFATNGAVVHRIGVLDEDAILLEVPHRQQDAEVASAASGQPNRWLGAPDGIGLIVRTAPDLTSEQLLSAAGRLLTKLKNAGCNADFANSDTAADFIVANLDELHDADLAAIAARARKGLAILCRSDRRSAKTTVASAHSPDVLLAQSLGWKLVVETADGALLEKGGRAAVLVNETIAMDGRDETVADVAQRLGAIGWQPIVSWRASPRTSEEFGKLLNDRAVAVNRRYQTIAETFDLRSPIPPGGDINSTPGSSADVHSAPTAGPVPPITTLPVREATSDPGLPQRLSGDSALRTSNEAQATNKNPDDDRRVAPTAEIVPLVPRLAANDRTTLLPYVGPIAQTLLHADNETAIAPAVAMRGDAGKHTKLRIDPTLLDSVFIENGGQHLPIPHIARLVVSTALQTKATDPICIILPSTEHVAQFTAILTSLQCLASDFSDNQKHFVDRYFKPGSSVRILPDGNVFVVGEKSTGLGIDGIFLGFTEKETLIGDGRRLTSNGELFRYEPTTRQLPKSKRSIKFNDPERTKVDELAGVRTFGNSGLNKNRIILVGSQKEFGRVLDGLSLVSQDPNQVRKPLADKFAWGNFDENGQPFALYPEGSGGAPLVAIARDLAELERASLHADVEAGSQIVLTDRLEHVLKNLDLANRVGERQRLILFADGRKRADALNLRKNGWKVWEPQPWELLSPVEVADPTKTGLLGFDRIQHSASAERRPSLAYLPKSARALSSAYELLGKLGEILGAESAVDDLRMQASMETVREIFFSVANWLSVPPSAQLAECSASLQHLRGEQTYVARYLGPDAGSAVGAFADAIESFVTSPRRGGITPKGDALLELARNAALNPTLKQVLVTGSRQSREEADAFLATNNIDLQCKLATELTDGDEFLSAISFSILRRDMFEKFIDPWPSKEIVLAGYDFEVELYKRRLRARGSQKKRLELNPDVRTSLTSLPATSFGSPTPATDADLLPDAILDQQSEPFEQFSRLGKSDAPRPIRIDVSSNEQTEDAHIVRFVGQSWMPMAVDYRPVCLVQGGSEGRKSGVEHIEISDLRPGMRIIVREGGEKDVIKAVAQDICGDEKYDRLWKRASLWRDALKSGDSDPSRVARRLQDSGVRRHIVTLRSWVTNPSLIGPRSDDDVLAIAKAFPIEGQSSADWKGCCEAISELRGLHLSAGTRLADHLVTRCGRMLLEPTETETAVEFQLGTVWILEVADVEPATRSAPSGLINRLQWLNNAWQARRYGERLKIMAA
ncbi:ATP-binding protein [Bradyrhizobium sp. 197]|uniref:DrmE family protein n=1 Tax=Bradyrhizobium sp. 197 TaxID=2782663 RepID=UPI001FF818C4|nr:DrmE family protein [Bradyrhizobium sp. 197]MCK1480543.1 ATP-binding protein [Bradyrhizobium sp. 197]